MRIGPKAKRRGGYVKDTLAQFDPLCKYYYLFSRLQAVLTVWQLPPLSAFFHADNNSSIVSSPGHLPQISFSQPSL